jgi:hypothetical protein
VSRRAIRRHHKDRRKAKARKLFGYLWPMAGWVTEPKAHHHADNFTLCSRWCCGNPRRWMKGRDRFTMQERRHMNGL